MASFRAPLLACTLVKAVTRSSPWGLKKPSLAAVDSCFFLNWALAALSWSRLAQPVETSTAAAVVIHARVVVSFMVSFMGRSLSRVPGSGVPEIRSFSSVASSQHAAVHEPDHHRAGQDDERGGKDEQHEREAHLDRRL